MIERRIVRRYATALFNAAVRMKVMDRVESDLGLISYAVESSPALVESLKNPLIPSGRKKEVVSDIFAGKVHEVTLSYLNLLIDKRREEAVALTEEEYVRLADEARGVVRAQVTTAVKLDAEQYERLRAGLSVFTGKHVEMTHELDPSIKGGVVVRIGDRVIDGSVRGQLEGLREKLES